MKLEGRCAVVTGAGSGLGHATAEILHKSGANVVLIDASDEGLKTAVDRFGKRVVSIRADVCNADEVGEAITLAKRLFGAVHIAVNCAGIASSEKIVSRDEAHDLALWQRVINVNLTGTFNVTRLAAKQMIQNVPDEETGERGVIVNTASIAGFEGQRGQAAYAASKAGVIGLTLPVARDLADKAVRCVAIAPGLFETSMLGGIPEKGIEALKRALLYPGRMGHPAEFGALVRQIIETPYLNGSCLRLDGGARLPA